MIKLNETETKENAIIYKPGKDEIRHEQLMADYRFENLPTKENLNEMKGEKE